MKNCCVINYMRFPWELKWNRWQFWRMDVNVDNDYERLNFSSDSPKLRDFREFNNCNKSKDTSHRLHIISVFLWFYKIQLRVLWLQTPIICRFYSTFVVLLCGWKMLLQTRASLLKRGRALEGKKISSLVDSHKSSAPVNAAGVCPLASGNKGTVSINN